MVENSKCMSIIFIFFYLSYFFFSHIFRIDWLYLFLLSFFVDQNTLLLNFSLKFLKNPISFYISWNIFDQDRSIWTRLSLTMVQVHVLCLTNLILLHLFYQYYEKILNCYLTPVNVTTDFYWAIRHYLIY